MSSRPRFPIVDVLIALSVPVLLIVSSFWIEPRETANVVLASGVVTALVLLIVGARLARTRL